MTAGRRRGEDGVSLIFVLAFVTVFGLCISGVMSMLFTGFNISQASRTHVAALYAADGGIDYGIQALRATSSYCPNVAAGSQSVPDQTLNGQTVHVTCQTLSGGSGSTPVTPTNFAVVATGYGLAPSALNKAIQTSGSTGHAGDTINITGAPVFSAGKFSFAGGSPKLIIGNDLHQYDYTSPNNWCTQDKSSVGSPPNPSVSGAWTCEQPGTYAVPDPKPTPSIPTATAPALSTSVTCKNNQGGATGTILYPGKYTSANKPTFSTGRYYLASGIYYFDGVGTLQLKGQIFGGTPAAGETQSIASSSATPCADDTMANALHAGSATGNGVEIILGGNSSLDFSNTTSDFMEFFTRAGGPGTDGVSIYADTAANPTLPVNYDPSTTASPIVTHGTSVVMVVHGMIYLPRAPVTAWALSTGPQFGGGLVCQTLTLSVNSTSGTGTLAGLSVPPPTASPRTVLITSSAAGFGGSPFVDNAVVTIGIDAGQTTTVQSWRHAS